jgi:hypothetical protein
MIVLAKIGICVCGAALLGGAALSSEGFVRVEVHQKPDDGTRLSLIVPAVVVPVGLRFVPPQYLAAAAENIRPYLPVIEAAIPALEQCPDGVFVEAIDAGEHVRIAKSGVLMVVEVDDPGETVHLVVPLRAAGNTIHQIAAANHSRERRSVPTEDRGAPQPAW